MNPTVNNEDANKIGAKANLSGYNMLCAAIIPEAKIADINDGMIDSIYPTLRLLFQINIINNNIKM